MPSMSATSRIEKRYMTLFNRILQVERKIEDTLIFLASVIITITFCLVVLLRYGFKVDLFAYEEWLMIIAFLLYFIGGAAATAQNGHIKADIVVELIKSEKTRAGFLSFVMTLETIIGLFLTYYAILMVMNEFVRWPNIPATTVYRFPLAIPRIFIMVGFALMTMHAAIHVVRYFNLYRSSEPTKTANLQEN